VFILLAASSDPIPLIWGCFWGTIFDLFCLPEGFFDRRNGLSVVCFVLGAAECIRRPWVPRFGRAFFRAARSLPPCFDCLSWPPSCYNASRVLCRTPRIDPWRPGTPPTPHVPLPARPLAPASPGTAP